MKNSINIFLVTILSCSFYIMNGQVGIGTNNPEGALDISSSTFGFVYPSAVLTSTLIPSPIVNPEGGNLAVGTTVYNTNTTNNGVNDVEPGIYSWDGTQWITHFFKKDNSLFEQTSTLRSRPSSGYQNIPGLGITDMNTFTPTYSGLYKIEVKVNFGGGRVRTAFGMNTVAAQGIFEFTFDSVTENFETESYSSYHPDVGGGKHYVNVWVESYINIYRQLTAGQSYSFHLQFDQFDAPGFQNNGTSGAGRGYVGADVKSIVEFTYLSE